ncbi:hypothetical protein KGF56_002444 [Candida oxycetoniae]|uniref:MARVEL domain-containing protein n=1 Tax=Candida oxycetoniae TaxID=497107 RepID=A0AAI9WYE0_9ASCO|nr:uncharacterized protein KGF56_002444 [Candida oxycetoniae]KAI3404741.2 hypothetical protein KGF56_002444 [Candida oxycetoniae]
MKVEKGLISLLIRGFQGVFAIVSLGLAATYLSGVGFNVDTISFIVATSVLTLLYLGYILVVVPRGINGQSPSLVILIGDTIFLIFYLAAWAAIASAFPTTCNFPIPFYYSSRYTSSTCRAAQALLPFTLFNWVLFVASLVLFLIYSYIPEVKNLGFKNGVKFSEYYWGCIYPSVDGEARKKWFGTWCSKSTAAAGTTVEESEAAHDDEQISSCEDKGTTANDDEANVGITSKDNDVQVDTAPSDKAPSTDEANAK